MPSGWVKESVCLAEAVQQLSFVITGALIVGIFTTGTDVYGVTRELAANRLPALYTGDYGDCLDGKSLFSVTKFDVAYYADNMTIVLHMDGTSSLRNESLMMRIAVDAYGENRLDMVVNPLQSEHRQSFPMCLSGHGRKFVSGHTVAPGLPLPGTRTGFPATLAAIGIPSADAFVFGLLWFLIAVALVVIAVVGVKILLEAFVSIKWIKEDRLAYFRSYWVGFLGHVLLRALIIGFFMLATLAIFQFTIPASVGPLAVTVIVFLFVVMGVISLTAYGVWYRTRRGTFSIVKDRAVFYRSRWLAMPIWESRLKEHNLEIRRFLSIPCYRLRHDDHDDEYPTVHLDQPYVKRFAWLTARFRRTRWWFLAYYVPYLFVRAAFLGGAGSAPLVQVYGVLVLDIANFAVTVIMRPFEGTRNTAMGVWILSICKILSTGISIAFLPRLQVNRIITTVLGVIIIVIQGFTIIALLILIIPSALSSRLSLLRNQEEFAPRWLDLVRIRYFDKMQTKAQDRWTPPKGTVTKKKERNEPTLPEPHFAVTGVRRGEMLEDDLDDSTIYDSQQSLHERNSKQSLTSPPRGRSSQAGGIRSRLSSGSLPRTGRVSRISWSSREFVDPALLERPDSTLAKRLSGITFTITPDDGSSMTTKDNSSVSGESSISHVRPQASFRSFRSQSTTRASSINEGGASTPTPTREAFSFPALSRPSTLPEAAEPDE